MLLVLLTRTWNYVLKQVPLGRTQIYYPDTPWDCHIAYIEVVKIGAANMGQSYGSPMGRVWDHSHLAFCSFLLQDVASSPIVEMPLAEVLCKSSKGSDARSDREVVAVITRCSRRAERPNERKRKKDMHTTAHRNAKRTTKTNIKQNCQIVCLIGEGRRRPILRFSLVSHPYTVPLDGALANIT